MPYHFEFDREYRILLVVAEGEFGDADQLGIIDAIKSHAVGLNVAAGIGDYSQLDSYTASAAAVQAAARMPSPYPPSTPRFLVAPHTHVFGASRMYQTIGDESRAKLRVVRSRAEALEALGVANPAFERIGG
jgi:hypothetical protein